jgi:hypothetical protein
LGSSSNDLPSSSELVTQSMCQVRDLRYRYCFLKIYFAIDLLAFYSCQSFADKTDEKNGRQDTKGSRGDGFGLWSCPKRDGSFCAAWLSRF